MEVPNILKRILIIHTGGTFGMLERSGLWESPKDGSQKELLKAIPELSQIAEIETLVPYTQDSAELSLDNINQLAEVISQHREVFDGFVVIHGTDTMAYSASALSFMLTGLGKPVVFTGSQRPFMQIRTDAKSNLINSVEIATGSMDEITIFFGNKLLRANRATKVSTWKFEAFESPNFPILGEAGMNITFNLHNDKYAKPVQLDFRPFSNLHAAVSVIPVYPGLCSEQLTALLHSSAQAYIMVAYGAGNIPTSDHAGLLRFIREAQDLGKIVAVGTQCHHGKVTLSIYESARMVRDLGALSCVDMTGEAAIMKLNYLLSRYPDDHHVVRNQFELDIAGELTEER